MLLFISLLSILVYWHLLTALFPQQINQISIELYFQPHTKSLCTFVTSQCAIQAALSYIQ